MAKVSSEAEVLSMTKGKIFGTIPILPSDVRDRLTSYSKAFGATQEVIYLRVFHKVLLMRGIAKPFDRKNEASFYWWIQCQKEIDHYCADVEALSELSVDIRRALTEVGVEYSRDKMETVVRKNLSPYAMSLFDELREDYSIHHPFEYSELQKLIHLSPSTLDEYALERLEEAKEAAIREELARHGLNSGIRQSKGKPGEYAFRTKGAKKGRKADVEESVDQYLAACYDLRIDSPLAVQLVERSGRSKGFWSKKLNDPVFLMALKKGVEKKQNFAKSEENVALWTEVSLSIIDLIAKVTNKIQRRRYRGHARERLVPDMDRFSNAASDEEKDSHDIDPE